MPPLADLQRMGKVFETIGLLTEILPPIEIKTVKRKVIDKDGNETLKEFIAIFIERPKRQEK